MELLIPMISIAAVSLYSGIRIGEAFTSYRLRNLMIERRVIASIRH
jgi:hypothetical protein